MSNVHFQRKLVADELWDTLFLVSEDYPTKEKTNEYRTLESGGFFVQIFHMHRIFVNGQKCASIREAKYEICSYI